VTGSDKVHLKYFRKKLPGMRLLWTSPEPVGDAVTLCTSESLPRAADATQEERKVMKVME
jgi:hypothetical protein